MKSMLPKLSLSIQTFSELRSKQYVYVDKTRDIERLLDAGKKELHNDDPFYHICWNIH